MSARRYLEVAACFLVCVPIVAFAAASWARTPVPAPVDGGVGETVFQLDNLPLGAPGTLPVGNSERDVAAVTVPPTPLAVRFPPIDTIGGDDVLVMQHDEAQNVSMDIAANGDIYVAVERWQGGSVGSFIQVYRSADAGTTFQLWGTLQGSGGICFYKEPHLQVIEGSLAGCFIAYSAQNPGGYAEIWFVRSPLGGSAAVFGTPAVVMSQSGINFFRPRFDTDVSSFADFFVYLVAEGWELGGATGADIWFARSANQGVNFQTPYKLAELLVPNRHYYFPDIAYGFGGRLHASWHFESSDGSFDSSVRYRRAANYASNGLADWENWVVLTATNDGYNDSFVRIEAGHASNQVVLGYRRATVGGVYQDTVLRISQNNGANWTQSVNFDEGPQLWGQIIEEPASGTWFMMGLHQFEPCLWTASATDLTSWSTWQGFADEACTSVYLFLCDLALNPAKDNRPAVVWNSAGEPLHRVLFDAAWRTDPGFPNFKPGFPLGLSAAPRSAPALVDVNGDGDLEIVFADGLNKIQVINHDGTSPPGWPVDVGTPLSDGPVAVGDLDGLGQMTLVVGTADGRAFAYNRTGALLPGWPINLTGAGHNVYVSIGALGGPSLRTIVACSSNRLYFRTREGVSPPGVPFWNLGVAYSFAAPAAIGDVDNDGTAEAVGGLGPYVFGLEMRGSAYEFYVNIGNVLSDAVTLGDLDLDGDLEIICPTADGVLHVRHHTGAVASGFPFSSGTTYDLTSAAIGQVYGTLQPELAIGRQDYTVHLLQYDGTQVFGYPQHTTTGWWLWGAPIIGRVDYTTSDVLVGARDRKCWAFNQIGVLCQGWPKDAGGYVQVSPAMGDLDRDGSVEIVFVADTQLLVMDINNSEAEAGRTWPMYGHDAQRTGCSDCPEDLATAVDPGDIAGGGSITRVSFALPSPNPIGDAATFEFAVPLRAAVSLDIFDLRGRRICTVYREETEPGAKSITWHGRTEQGERLASGQYLARLQVRGPGVDELLTRKVSILH